MADDPNPGVEVAGVVTPKPAEGVAPNPNELEVPAPNPVDAVVEVSKPTGPVVAGAVPGAAAPFSPNAGDPNENPTAEVDGCASLRSDDFAGVVPVASAPNIDVPNNGSFCTPSEEDFVPASAMPNPGVSVGAARPVSLPPKENDAEVEAAGVKPNVPADRSANDFEAASPNLNGAALVAGGADEVVPNENDGADFGSANGAAELPLVVAAAAPNKGFGEGTFSAAVGVVVGIAVGVGGIGLSAGLLKLNLSAGLLKLNLTGSDGTAFSDDCFSGASEPDGFGEGSLSIGVAGAAENEKGADELAPN